MCIYIPATQEELDQREKERLQEKIQKHREKLKNNETVALGSIFESRVGSYCIIYEKLIAGKNMTGVCANDPQYPEKQEWEVVKIVNEWCLDLTKLLELPEMRSKNSKSYTQKYGYLLVPGVLDPDEFTGKRYTTSNKNYPGVWTAENSYLMSMKRSDGQITTIKQEWANPWKIIKEDNPLSTHPCHGYLEEPAEVPKVTAYYDNISEIHKMMLYKRQAFLHDEYGNITYYAAKKCPNATTWCTNHCYAQDFHKILEKTSYKLNEFSPEHKEEIPKAFLIAENVTFAGSGEIEFLFDKPFQEVISTLCAWYPGKKFHFFLRTVPDELVAPENCTISFSADCTTNPDLLKKAIASSVIKVINIVNHADNKKLIASLKKKIKSVIYCRQCKGSARCNYSTSKTLAIGEYWKPSNVTEQD